MSRSAYLAKLLEDAGKARKSPDELTGEKMRPHMGVTHKQKQADSDNFGESTQHGFPGGGAESSLVQPADLLAGPLAEAFVPQKALVDAGEGLVGRATQFVRDIPFKKHEATVAYKTAEANGGRPVASAIKEFWNVRKQPEDDISRFMSEASNAFKAKYDTSEKLSAFKQEAQEYQDFIDKWRKEQEMTPAQRAASRADTNVVPFKPAEASVDPGFNEAVVEAKKALAPAPGPVPAAPGPQEVTTLNPGRPAISAPPAASGKIPANPGEGPHPAGYSPKQVVNKQKDLLNAYFESKGMEKYAKGGTVYDTKEAQRVAEEARLRAEATPVVPRIPSHADYRAADPVTLNKRGVTDAPVHRMRTIEPKVQHLPPLALPLDFAEAKPHEKDFDGVSQHLAHGGEVYHCAADAVHNYAFGGIAGVNPEEEHIVRPVAPALRGPATGVPEQKVTGVAIGQPQDIVGYGDFAPVTIDSEKDKGPDQQQLNQAATVQEVKSEGPNALDEIERQRRQDLADTKPGTGSKVARVLSSALLGFAGKPSIDFAAGDKAARDEINAEAGNRKAAYLSGPGEQAGRDAAVAESPISGRLRNLVGTITGKPELAAGMSAAELHGATPLVQDYLQAVRAGDMQRIQVAKLALEESHNAAAERQGDERNRIADRMADAAMLRSGKTDKVHEDDVVSKYLNAQSSARNAPAYSQIQKDELALDKIDELLQKPLDTDGVTKLKVELAKIASGGEGSQHIQDELGSPTLRTKAALMYRYLTSQPTDAGYKDIVEKSIKPYVAGVRKVVGTSKLKHDAEFLQKWLPLLPPDFAATEKARIAGPQPGGAPLPEASLNDRKNDPFAEFGGHAE